MASREKIQLLSAQLEQIIASCKAYEARYATRIAGVHRKFSYSARNLVHYRALRRKSRSRVQKRLRNLGLSRLAKAESHVLPSLYTTQQLLQMLGDAQYQSAFEAPEYSIKKARRILKRNVRALLNKRSKRRRSRIMVTMPSEAAVNYPLVRDMLNAGMDAARINCAHDNPETWKRIIDNLRAAVEETGRPCVITMDLSGPKIRTGAIEPGPEVVKVRPPKDARGQVIKSTELWLGEGNPLGLQHAIPIELISPISPVQLLHFTDARNKKRSMVVQEAAEGGFIASLNKTSYFEAAMELYGDMDKTEVVARVGTLPAIEGSIYLVPGDRLKITSVPVVARHRPQIESEDDSIPEIQCTNQEVFADLKTGEPIVMDDGKFQGIIEQVEKNHLVMEVTQVRGGGAKLRAEKGINFPASKLRLRGLTEKDREDLVFVMEHADVVNMSFVNTSQDVEDLLDAIRTINPKRTIGVVLKIETERAFHNLTDILLAGMQTYPLGVMIARGDLALEVGWLKLASTQREIMKLCHAAHVPDIWATQVFENLAKKGVPSRAEMTDVWVAQRSECVMLNKGPYIIQAIEMLDAILTKMEPFRDKEEELMPMMEKAGK